LFSRQFRQKGGEPLTGQEEENMKKKEFMDRCQRIFGTFAEYFPNRITQQPLQSFFAIGYAVALMVEETDTDRVR
jgi:hypothetical protein